MSEHQGFFYVWFFIDNETNLHKDTVRAKNAAGAAQFMRNAWPGHTLEIVTVKPVQAESEAGRG